MFHKQAVRSIETDSRELEEAKNLIWVIVSVCPYSIFCWIWRLLLATLTNRIFRSDPATASSDAFQLYTTQFSY